MQRTAAVGGTVLAERWGHRLQAVGICRPAEVELPAAETRAMADTYRSHAADAIALADARWETTCREAPEIVADALTRHSAG